MFLFKFGSRIVVLSFLVALLSACVVQRPLKDWPQGIPELQHFQTSWQQDSLNQSMQSMDDYLIWVQRFYQGFNIVPGWLDMTQQVNERIPEADRERIGQILFELGSKIGAEWAKTNEARVLNTRSAAVWRDALIEALNQDDLDNYLQRLQKDVDDLLAGNISNDDIYFERYYVDEFDF